MVQCKCYLQQEPMSHAQGHRPMQMLPPARTNVTCTRSSSNANVTSSKNQCHMAQGHRPMQMLPPTRTSMSHARGHRPMQMLPPTRTDVTCTSSSNANVTSNKNQYVTCTRSSSHGDLTSSSNNNNNSNNRGYPKSETEVREKQ
jgi:hypothetical protein